MTHASDEVDANGLKPLNDHPQLSFLPCLRRGSKRWWLPCEASVSLLLAELLVQNRTSVSPSLRQRLRRAVKQSPPLFLFCAYHLSVDEATEEMDFVSIDDFVTWLETNFAKCVLDGEAFLGLPGLTRKQQKQCAHLRSFFQTLPIEEWLENGHLWLELTGSKFPKKIQKRWCDWILDSDGLEPTIPVPVPETTGPLAQNLLEKLARQTQQLEAISLDFDKQVKRRKTEAIKELAYGLSHEINNPLANISARAQQLERSESDSTRVASLKRISEQVYRAHEMIADLMFYANPPSKSLERVDIARVAQDVADRYHSQATANSINIKVRQSSTHSIHIDGRQRYDQPRLTPMQRDQGSSILVDRAMIEEAIGSLIRNSMEAISDQGLIEITVIVEESHLNLEIADSGPGLSEQARQNAFDPYFSGREAGRGLGLGLCRVARIAELHGGTAEIIGSIAGCVARITLPRS